MNILSSLLIFTGQSLFCIGISIKSLNFLVTGRFFIVSFNYLFVITCIAIIFNWFKKEEIHNVSFVIVFTYYLSLVANNLCSKLMFVDYEINNNYDLLITYNYINLVLISISFSINLTVVIIDWKYEISYFLKNISYISNINKNSFKLQKNKTTKEDNSINNKLCNSNKNYNNNNNTTNIIYCKSFFMYYLYNILLTCIFNNKTMLYIEKICFHNNINLNESNLINQQTGYTLILDIPIKKYIIMTIISILIILIGYILSLAFLKHSFKLKSIITKYKYTITSYFINTNNKKYCYNTNHIDSEQHLLLNTKITKDISNNSNNSNKQFSLANFNPFLLLLYFSFVALIKVNYIVIYCIYICLLFSNITSFINRVMLDLLNKNYLYAISNKENKICCFFGLLICLRNVFLITYNFKNYKNENSELNNINTYTYSLYLISISILLLANNILIYSKKNY